MGVTWQEFWQMNPHIINCIQNGYKEKIKRQDYLQHAWWGTYGLSAVAVAVEHAVFGEKAKSEYIKNAISLQDENVEKGYKESQEEVAVFEMKQRIEMLRQKGLPESPM